jgi:hypothetical protein
LRFFLSRIDELLRIGRGDKTQAEINQAKAVSFRRNCAATRPDERNRRAGCVEFAMKSVESVTRIKRVCCCRLRPVDPPYRAT